MTVRSERNDRAKHLVVSSVHSSPTLQLIQQCVASQKFYTRTFQQFTAGLHEGFTLRSITVSQYLTGSIMKGLRAGCLISWLMCLSVIAVRGIPIQQEDRGLTSLHIVHLNDFHARYEKVSPQSGACKDESKCLGGLARVAGAVAAERARDPELLFLNAGDNFQGTLWYSLFRWNVTAHFLNMLKHDAMTLGNHEFDHGIEGIVPFLERINCPVVIANIDDSAVPEFRGKYKKSIVVERNGQKIAVIGFMWEKTPTIAATGGLVFTDELEALDAEAARLKSEEGINIVVGLSHSGVDVDLDVAARSAHVDVIVGGHSHTLLYSGTPPNGEVARGPYPTVVEQPSGRKVLVVQAEAYTKFLGNITVEFDKAGEVVSWSGNPIYLDSSITEDQAILDEMEPWRQEVIATGARVVGSSLVELDKSRHSCYKEECTLGNFVTEAMVDEYAGKGPEGSWTKAAIALTNAGSLRTNIPSGNITFNDLVTAQPFENTVDLVELQGKHLLQLLEDSVSSLTLLQWSGLRVVFDYSRPAGQRVVHLVVRCSECLIPSYEELDLEKWYTIVAPSYVIEGGDNYQTIVQNHRNRVRGGKDLDMFLRYLKQRSPLVTEADGRIVILNANERNKKIDRHFAKRSALQFY